MLLNENSVLDLSPAGTTAFHHDEINGLRNIFNAVKRSKRGVSIAQLKAKTGLNPRQLSNALYKLSKKGTIVAKSRGLYVAK